MIKFMIFVAEESTGWLINVATNYFVSNTSNIIVVDLILRKK